jgi:hypothetical protein
MAETHSERITVTCECGAKLGLRAVFAGHKAKCPKCSRSFVVPAPGQAPTAATPTYPSPEPAPQPAKTAASTAEVIIATCPCGKRMRVPASAVGRKARCPACAGVFIVGTASEPVQPVRPRPATRPVAPPPPPPPPEQEEQPDDGTYGWSESTDSLLSEAEAQPAAAAGPSIKLCPHCGTTMQADARLCVACGFDTKTGRRMQDTSVSGGSGKLSAVGGVLGSAVRSGGAILLGTFLSFLGAMLGAALWAGIAYAIKLELGYVAWAVGGLAGGGMYLGFRNQSTIAGLIASFMAVLGIVVGKIAVFVIVILSMVASMSSELDKMPSGDAETEITGRASLEAHRSSLADHHATLKGNHQGLSYDDPKRQTILNEERTRFNSMTQAQVQKAAEDLKKWEDGGKWKDSAYVRDFIIYTYIDEALEAEAKKTSKKTAAKAESDEDSDSDSDSSEIMIRPSVTPAKWQELYRAAVKRADAIPADKRLAEVKRIETEQEKQAEKAAAEMEAAMGDVAAEAAKGIASFFFSEMFGFVDILFILLAISTAYYLASGLSFGG